MHVALRQVLSLPRTDIEQPQRKNVPETRRGVISVSPDQRGQPHCDPVGAFAGQIAALDQIAVDVLRGAVAQSALKARVRLGGAY